MDMKGKTLHKWSCDLGTWGTANIDKEGNLYVVIDGRSLCKIDWDSGIIWNCESGFHHWVSLAQNGDIYSIVWGRLDITYRDRTIPVLNDYITILSRDGTIKKQLSIYKMFGDRIPETKLDTIYNVVYSDSSRGRSLQPWRELLRFISHQYSGNNQKGASRDLQKGRSPCFHKKSESDRDHRPCE
ncbi:MAG: hypothetical protein AB9903_06965 [Vulcanimicrobiota bacterium]